MTSKLGFIGAGHLASYTIAGLRRAGDQRDIILSPRNAEKAQQLSSQYNCSVAASNQAVVDAADIVILAVRPPQALVVLSELTLRPEQCLISVVAGISVSQLRSAMLGGAEVCRSLIVSSAAYNKGAVSLYPANYLAQQLLGCLGEIVTLELEKDFDLSLAAMCANGWMYKLVESLEQPMLAAGMPPSAARKLVVQSIVGTMAHIENSPAMDLSEISAGIATDGTYTKIGLDILEQQQAFDPWQDAIQTLLMGQNND